MKSNKEYTKYIWNGLAMVMFIALTFAVIYRNNDMALIKSTISGLNIKYIIPAVGCLFLFTFGEALNIRRTLRKVFKYNLSILQGIKYALVGFFFSSITPSATGGQPMQVYYMKRDGIDVGHSSLALLLELTSFQLVTVATAVISIAADYESLRNLDKTVIYLLCFGAVMNGIMLLFIGCAVFSNNFAVKAVNGIFNFLSKIGLMKKKNVRDSILREVYSYKKGVIQLKNHRKVIFTTVITSVVQILCSYSITYFVYRAFGFNELSWIKVVSYQSLLFLSVSSLPIPGAVGISEGVFLMIFGLIYPAGYLESAMVISRGINFYLLLVISAVVVIISTMKKSVKAQMCSIEN